MMGIRYNHKGKDTLGHGSQSILPKYEIRNREQSALPSRRKQWFVWDYSTQSTVFEANTKRECAEYLSGNENVFVLAATHDWGMFRKCSVCQKLRPVSRFYYKFTRDKFHSRCMPCENLANRKRRAKKREETREATLS